MPLSKMCTVRPETWSKWHGPQAGSTMFLSVNEQVSVENLLHGIVTLSGNDASVVLAECIAGTEQAFAGQMNALAAQLGLKNSHFGNSNGWPDEGVTYVTARDLATLAKASIERHPKLYKQFYGQPSFTWGKTLGSGADITQGNRNPILGKIPGADGLKTGHTDEAGYGFTGSAEQNGRRLVMVVAGLSSFNQRIEESTRLMNWGFAAWQAKPLFKSGAKVGSAQVQLGSENEIGLIAPRDLAVTIPAGLLSKTSMKIRYAGPVKAPIAKGQHIADLIVTSSDTGEQVMPLVAEEAVGEAGFFGRMWAGLKQMLGMA
jgi:D-alanyl-D-alanine carboxypeptidase (penicillin-binding protein 5/6)